MVRTSQVVTLLAALALAAPAARAQYAQRRDGFWIGFGLGYGSANVSCDQCSNLPRVGGYTGFLKLGGSPSRNVLIGASLNGWTRERLGVNETMGNVTASLYYYPVTTSGFFVTGGLGFSGYNINSSPEVNGSGWGFTAGGGYDVRIGRNISLTPVVNYIYGALGDFDVPGLGTRTGWKQNVIDVGLGLTFH